MKKGCILKFIFIFVFFIGSSYYILTKYGSEIFNPVKEKLESLKIQNTLDEISQLKSSVNPDSLNVLIGDVYKNLNKKFEKERIKEDIFKEIKKITKSSDFPKVKLKKLKEFIKRYEK